MNGDEMGVKNLCTYYSYFEVGSFPMFTSRPPNVIRVMNKIMSLLLFCLILVLGTDLVSFVTLCAGTMH